MTRFLAIALTIALGTVALACGGGDAPSTAKATEPAQPTPTALQNLTAESLPSALPSPTAPPKLATQPSPTVQPAIAGRPVSTARPALEAKKDGFVSFTDAKKLFTVSHPADWELAHSVMVDVDEIVGRVNENGDSDVQGSPIGVVFFAGVPAQQGYNPNVSIVVESLPTDLAVTEYFESTQEFARGMFTGYTLRSQRSVQVTGREAIMTDLEFDIPSSAPGSRKWRSIQTLTVDGGRGWAISCGFAAPVSAEELQTCDSVVRSFELLQ